MRWVWISIAAFLVLAASACRGTSPALPPATGVAAAPSRDASSAAVTGNAITFVPLGPTRMFDFLPSSGKVNAYAVDPNDRKTIYVASGRGTGLETYSSAGIFRTTDGGASWSTADAGLVDPSGAISSVVNALWIDPAKPSVLLAASEYDGIFRTTDAGVSWSSVYRTAAATQFASYGGALYAAAAKGILVSTDGGAHWSVSLAGTPQRWPVAFGAVSGSGGSAFYAGMTDGTIFAFANGTWTYRGMLPFTSDTHTDGSTPAVHQIAVDPLRPSLVYASSNDGTWDQDLHASIDGGVTWNTVFKNRYENLGLGTQAIAFSVVHPHRVYLGTDGGFYYFEADGAPKAEVSPAANLSVIDIRDVWPVANGADDACWVASDQGLTYESRCSLHDGKVFNDDVVTKTVASGLARRFAISPDGRFLVTSLQDFESHETFDGGKTWHVKDALYEDGFNELQPGNPHNCYAYDEANGLSVSTNGCVKYRFPGYYSGIYPSRLMTTPMAFNPTHPRQLYLMAGPIVGFATAKFGAFTTSDDGRSFTRLAWPFARPGMIVVDATNSKHMLVGDLKGGASSLSVTTDGGTTWTASSGVPPTAFWYSATISPTRPNVALASSVDADNNVFVLRSTDGGRTFERVATVVNAPLLRIRTRVDRPELERLSPPAFVYSPAREIRFNQDAAKGVPDVALTTLRGAFLSTDLGNTWTRLDDRLIAHSFWGIRWRDGYLYLGSDGQGVVVSARPVQR
ncbi:MAG TPA: hypothetical protein VMF61_04495 [Candidatus Acidoferrales bacterium]|nr:hypothetical protein [Candidatus Acidoferrales bacterium]